MLASTPNTSGKWLALLALAVIACGGRTSELGGPGGSSGGGGGSGGSGGAFPYSGPSCTSSMISTSCWSCLESDCPALVSCVTGACSGYFTCFCACNPGDNACLAGCQQNMTSSCASCVQSADTCATQSCQAQCTTQSMTGGSGGSSTGGGGTSGGGGGSSGGPTLTSECSGSSKPCANGQTMESCLTLDNGTCTGAYFQVGTQTFPCASCTDTMSCQQQAMMACQ